MIIYKIENKINGKIYIGQTNKFQKRMGQHTSEQKTYIGKALKKYGIESFVVSIIDEAPTRDVLNEKEKFWIKFYDCRAPNGYNLTDGGEGCEGQKFTDETKQKMRIAKLGRTISDEQKKKQSEALRGIVFSEERKQNISKALTGKVFTEERKRNLSIARMGEGCNNYGKHFSEEHKRKLSESNIGKHVMSEETKRKMSISATGRHHTEETKKKIGEASRTRIRGKRIKKVQPLLIVVNQ